MTGRPPLFTAHQVNEAVELYRSGLSVRKVAAALGEKHGVAPSYQWVFNHVRAAGIVRRNFKTPHRYSHQVLELRAVGLRYKQIAEITGLSIATVHRIVKGRFQ